MGIAIIARELAEEVLARPAPASPRAIELPHADDDSPRSTESIGYAEGQSFVIEYLDSANRPSTRRVTVWSIVAGSNGVPCLFAYCHERKAKRQFRVDRIQCFIDYDGEVFQEVPKFLADNFGMDIALAMKTSDVDRRWNGILENIRHNAVILAALARSDGRIASEEIDEAERYLTALAERSGIMLDVGDVSSIRRYVSRLRPTEEAIMKALDQLSDRDPGQIKRLLMAAMRVVDADGHRHPREMALINAIAEDLTGAPIS